MLKTTKYSTIFFIVTLITFVRGAEKTGYLSVAVEDGMNIYVDTTFVGRYSFSLLELPVGNHSVHVYNDQVQDWADRGIIKKIIIMENEVVELEFSLSAQIKVLSLPVGGKVFAGEELIGNTPISFNRDLVGTNIIKIEKDGYAERSFDLKANQNEYKVNLVPIEDETQIRVARLAENRNSLKWYREGLIVTSLISSWAAFYYKRQADQAHLKFLTAPDSRRRFVLWNHTRQYDSFSEISIAVAVSTLSTYIFLLLID